MTTFASCRWRLGVVLAFALMIASPSWAAEMMEEIVVTGSYIKRDNFDTPSPLSIVDAIEIAEQGTPNTGDIIFNQTFNFGVDRMTNALGINPTGGIRTFANARGLGPRATMELMDGRRLLFGDSNFTYPQVALERIETLKDGAAALYGSEAVAAVVNYVPRKSFEGLKVQLDYRQPTEGLSNEIKVGLLGGASNDTTRVIMALEFRQHGDIEQREIKSLIRGSDMASATGQPGTWRVPNRDATGALTGTTSQFADPACGNQAENPSDDLSVRGNHRMGMITDALGRTATDPLQPSTRCRFQFGEYFSYKTELEQNHGYLNFEHQFTDKVSFESEVVFGRQTSEGRGSPSNPGGRVGDLIRNLGGAVAGDHPGNPYRAYFDANSNRRIDPGEPIFALDTDNNGVPDRDCGSGFDPANDGNVQCTVMVDPVDTFTSVPGQNVAFSEDVTPVALRLFAKGLRGRPIQQNDDGSSPSQTTIRNFRYSGGFHYDLLDTGWTGSAMYTYHIQEIEGRGVNQSFGAVVEGMQGTLGLLDDRWYNPFGTSQLVCTDRVCGPDPQPEFVDTDSDGVPDTRNPAFNSQEAVNEIYYKSTDIDTTTLNMFDLVLSGDLVDLPAGPLSAAFGMQWRRVELEAREGAHENRCDEWIGACGFDLDAERMVWAGFYEFIVPVFDLDTFGRLELQAAGRYTDVEDVDHSFDPKFAILYQPTDWVSLRGSRGSAFIAPTLTQLFDTSGTSGLQNMSDTTCEVSGTCSTARAFRNRRNLGNPDLQPEEADIWSAGFTILLLDSDLTLEAEWFNFDFKERITSANGQEVLNLDQPRFQAYFDPINAATCPGDGSAADIACRDGIRQDWINEAIKATCTPGVDCLENPQIERSPTGEITNIITRNINAQKMDWKGGDFRIRYRWDSSQIPWIGGDYGSFSIEAATTYTDEFSFKLSDASPITNGAGSRNDWTATLQPIPRWRANFSTRWTMGPNNLVAYVRYQDRVLDRSSSGACRTELDPNTRLFTKRRCSLPSQTTWDMQYSRQFDGLLGSERATTFTVGCINCGDNVPEPIWDGGGIEQFLFDPRGRILYARWEQDI